MIKKEVAAESRSWPFEEALKILERINYTTPKKGYVLFETGYGPSGLPHIGTFGEVARTTMVRRAFCKMSDIPTRLICFSDDMDGLRKVPSNVPQPEMVAQHMNRPLTSIPDPFGETESYGHYMNAKLRSFLDSFNFEYEFFSATDCYKRGMFNDMMLLVIDRYDQIMELMLPTFREERQATYSPFMPVCPRTGRVLQVPIIHTNRVNGTVTYKDPENGEKVSVSVLNGSCKLQWKPDFGMRWSALSVDYEMYGKDHMPNAKLYSEICRILGSEPPVQYFYELFLNEGGQKISKSKGNSLTIDEWLHYAPLESLSLFMFHSPSKAKRLHFDVIPKMVDEYLTFVQKYHEASAKDDVVESKLLANPAYHIHNGEVPKIETYGVSFGMVLNLASACNPEDADVLWGFIIKYAPDASKEKATYLNNMIQCGINYYNDFIKPNKRYAIANEKQIAILNSILNMLIDMKNADTEPSGEEMQNGFYAIGTDAGYENLREYFKEMYMLLLGQEEGPRLGSFVKLFGIENSIALVKSAIDRQ